MNSDREFDEYLNNLAPEDQQALNNYMDNLDLENNPQLDEYLDHIEEVRDDIAAFETSDTTAADMSNTSKLKSYIELEPEIESFQDYSTGKMKPVNPLEVSLLDTDYEAPVVDTIRYKGVDGASDNPGDSSGSDILTSDVQNQYGINDRAGVVGVGNNDALSSSDEAKKIAETLGTVMSKSDGNMMEDGFYGGVAYVDNSPLDKPSKNKKRKKRRSPAAFIVILLLLLVGGGAFAVYYFSDGFTDFAFVDKLTGKEETATEAVTEEIVTTEEVTTEEATTEEPPGPYATVDYTLHTPHTTDSTIVYNSNPYSLRYPQEEWPIMRDDAGNEREATQEDLYPVITLEAVEGSLNYTNPDPSNIAETQVMTSRYMVLVDLSDDSIVAKRDSDVIVNPASMTKILTVLTAADMIEDLDDTFIMTEEAIKYAYDNDGSAVGFLVGEKVTVRDLIYGTIVCSGADAAVGLAQYCCGSHEAFVEKMNEKAEELGISDTAHFTNVVGMYDENLHCTMEDMAVILSTAVQNELLMDVLNTRIYQTTPDPTILPEDVRKELGIGINGDSNNDNPADEQSADSAAEGENDTAQTQTNEGSGEADDAATDDATTEEIDPGLLLIAKDGIQISNWFMRRIEDKNTGGEVLGAKTGFVNAAGFCCASYYKSNSGKEYICVTGDTYSSWRCIYDHVGIYRSLAK